MMVLQRYIDKTERRIIHAYKHGQDDLAEKIIHICQRNGIEVYHEYNSFVGHKVRLGYEWESLNDYNYLMERLGLPTAEKRII